MLLTVHLLAAGLATAGPVLAWQLGGQLRKQGDASAVALGRQLLVHSIAALCWSTALGGLVVAWLYWQRPSFFTAAARLPTSRYWFAGAELLFSAVCLAVAVRLWPQAQDERLFRRFGRGVMLWLGVTNLAYHFPTLFAAISVLARRRDLSRSAVRFVDLLGEPLVLARTLHFLLAAVVATGVWTLWLELRRSTASAAESSANATAATSATVGARWALVATLLQVLCGVWLLTTLTATERELLFGGDLWATGCLTASIFFLVLLLHRLFDAALGAVEPRAIRQAALLLVLIFASMVAARQRIQGRTKLSVWQPSRMQLGDVGLDAATRRVQDAHTA